MGVYDRQIASAKRQIAAKGRACLWRSSGVVVPSNGLVAAPAAPVPADVPVSVVYLPDNRQNRAYLQQLAGSDIVIGADYGLMGQAPFTPRTDDEIYDETGTELLRTVYEARPFAPNGEVILWTLFFNAVEEG